MPAHLRTFCDWESTAASAGVARKLGVHTEALTLDVGNQLLDALCVTIMADSRSMAEFKERYVGCSARFLSTLYITHPGVISVSPLDSSILSAPTLLRLWAS